MAHLALGATLPLALAAGCADPRPAATRSPSGVAPHAAHAQIEWQPWSPAAFERARAEDRLIVVDVGIEGCTACRWMHEQTYTDPAVVDLVTEHFVPILVDADARPDLGERYSPWAWPAIIFLTPQGEQVLAIRGSKIPRNFIPILQDLLARKQAGTLSGATAEPQPPLPADVPLTELRDRVRAQLERYADFEDGGFSRRGPKGMYTAATEHAYWRAHLEADPKMADLARRTAEGMRTLIDPTWGGVFVANIGRWGARVIPEKRTRGQAGAMAVWLHAYGQTPPSSRAQTQDDPWLQAITAVDRYLQGFMRTGNLYGASQEDDAPRLPAGMTASAYYRLPDAQRRAYGIPPIDHGAYTDINALLITAYGRWYESTGEPAAVRSAVAAADELLHERRRADGLLAQVSVGEAVKGDARMRPVTHLEVAYLRPQGPMGQALLTLHRVTADPRWLAHARELADGALERLQDPADGGFFASDDASLASNIGRDKPVLDNARMAHFLYELSVYTHDPRYREAGRRALLAVGQPERVRAEGRAAGPLALALELYTAGYVEISVLGGSEDPRAQALHRAALRAYEPRKVLHDEGPGRYPASDHPVAYICNETACSQPIADPAKIPEVLATFRPASSG